MGFKSLFIVFGLLFSLNKAQVALGQDTVNGKPLQNQVLSCLEVKTRVNQMLDLHYLYSDFNGQLSDKTYHKFFEKLDPAKIFFTTFDLNKFSDIKNNLGEKIESGQCDFIFKIYNLYKTRVQKRIEKAHKILNKSISISPQKSILVAKTAWARNEQDLDERLRKRILFQYLKLKKENPDEKEIEKIIYNNFSLQKGRLTSLSNDKIYSIFLNSFAESLDPHSAHMLPEDQNSFTIHITNKLEGIGAELEEKNGFIRIKSLIKGGVAQRDGRLKVNDKLIAINPGNGTGLQNLKDLDIERAIELIRGPKGTKVILEISRETPQGEEKITLSLVREEISLQYENVKSEIYTDKEVKIGVIKIPSFYTDLKCQNKLFPRCKGVSFDTSEELKKLSQSGVDGILIDLRNNGGGDFPESIKLTSLFVPHGVVVQIVDKNKFVSKQQTVDNAWLYKGPLIVLVNRYTASSSEIFAGAIQDYERGIIVGDDHTYGKATIQVFQEIPGAEGRNTDGAIKVTQNKFYRPGGLSNQRIGVRSDILDESVFVAYDIGEDFLDYALPHDTISAVKSFKPVQKISSLIKKCKKLSIERLEKNKEYQEVLEKIEKIKSQKNSLIPLKLEEIESIQSWFDANEQLNPNLDKQKKSDNNVVIDKNDLQLMEAIAIAKDSVKLSRAAPVWIGE